MDYSKQRDKTIVVKERGCQSQIFIDEIVYVECDGYLSTLFLRDKTKVGPASWLLKDIEHELTEYGFCRINRNTLINTKYCKRVINGEKRKVIIEDDIEMKISRRQWPVLKEIIHQ